jgi:hypothetical protein
MSVSLSTKTNMHHKIRLGLLAARIVVPKIRPRMHPET